MDAPWKIQLLGGLRAQSGEHSITRFRTRKTAALFAYLAYHGVQSHSRETLIDQLWPEDEMEAGRNSLRVALNSLRHQLEPPGVPPGAVLIADRVQVRLNPAGAVSDAAEFEEALKSARSAAGTDRQAKWEQSIALYRGELLPGYYEDWIGPERTRLAEACLGAMHQLVSLLTEAQDWERAIYYAQRAVSADALSEESRCGLMRVYAAQGRTAEALFQYHELQRLLHEELDSSPSRETGRLAESLFGGALKDKGPGRPRPPRRLSRRKASPEAPPPVSPTAIPVSEQSGRLPLTFTRFFGRGEEMARLQDLLCAEQTRLVTLTGPGGTGKTRLAVETAGRLRGIFGGSVWFVPLADLSRPELIAGAVRDTLRLPRTANDDPLEQVIAALSAAPSLLALDNFEQLAAGGAPVVLTLLKRVSTLKCLVTSRRRLGLPGERVIPLSPLPPPDDSEPLDRLAANAAVQLFVDRSQAVRPDFQITERNAPAVAELCRRLEGLPLAIELVAARSSALTPTQMRDRLAQRFDLVQSRRKGRHGSLWIAIQWSHDLLPPHLQLFFARLSVFRGGWDLEAAEAVCEEPHALELLSQLQSHSFVLAEDASPVLRFRLLETLREFAWAQLSEGEKEAARVRHADWFFRLAVRAEPELAGAEHGPWSARLGLDHENLWAAAESALTQGERFAQPLTLAHALWRYWYARGHVRAGRQMLERLLAHPNALAPPGDRANVLMETGIMAMAQGDMEAAQGYFHEGLALFDVLGDPVGIADALHLLGNVALQQSDYLSARHLYEESARLKRTRGEIRGLADTLNNLALIADRVGNAAEARQVLEEVLAIRQAQGDLRNEAYVWLNLGANALDAGDLETARRHCEASLALCQATDDRWGGAYALSNLGELARLEGDLPSARAHLEEAFSVLTEVDDKACLAETHCYLGRLAWDDGDLTAARIHFRQSLELNVLLSEKRGLAKTLNQCALLAASQKHFVRATRLWGCVDAILEQIGSRLPPIDLPPHDRAIDAARAALSPEAFGEAWNAGRLLTTDEAVTLALEN